MDGDALASARHECTCSVSLPHLLALKTSDLILMQRNSKRPLPIKLLDFMVDIPCADVGTTTNPRVAGEIVTVILKVPRRATALNHID
jgi:hypothetical protein